MLLLLLFRSVRRWRQKTLAIVGDVVVLVVVVAVVVVAFAVALLLLLLLLADNVALLLIMLSMMSGLAELVKLWFGILLSGCTVGRVASDGLLLLLVAAAAAAAAAAVARPSPMALVSSFYLWLVLAKEC